MSKEVVRVCPHCEAPIGFGYPRRCRSCGKDLPPLVYTSDPLRGRTVEEMVVSPIPGWTQTLEPGGSTVVFEVRYVRFTDGTTFYPTYPRERELHRDADRVSKNVSKPRDTRRNGPASPEI